MQILKRFFGGLLLLVGCLIIAWVVIVGLQILGILLMGFIGTGGREAGEYILPALGLVVGGLLVGFLFIKVGAWLVKRQPHSADDTLEA